MLDRFFREKIMKWPIKGNIYRKKDLTTINIIDNTPVKIHKTEKMIDSFTSKLKNAFPRNLDADEQTKYNIALGNFVENNFNTDKPNEVDIILNNIYALSTGNKYYTKIFQTFDEHIDAAFCKIPGFLQRYPKENYDSKDITNFGRAAIINARLEKINLNGEMVVVVCEKEHGSFTQGIPNDNISLRKIDTGQENPDILFLNIKEIKYTSKPSKTLLEKLPIDELRPIIKFYDYKDSSVYGLKGNIIFVLPDDCDFYLKYKIPQTLRFLRTAYTNSKDPLIFDFINKIENVLLKPKISSYLKMDKIYEIMLTHMFKLPPGCNPTIIVPLSPSFKLDPNLTKGTETFSVSEKVLDAPKSEIIETINAQLAHMLRPKAEIGLGFATITTAKIQGKTIQGNPLEDDCDI